MGVVFRIDLLIGDLTRSEFVFGFHGDMTYNGFEFFFFLYSFFFFDFLAWVVFCLVWSGFWIGLCWVGLESCFVLFAWWWW